MQALPDAAESLCIAEMGGTEERDGQPGLQGQLYLNIGKLVLFTIHLSLYMMILTISVMSMSIGSTS